MPTLTQDIAALQQQLATMLPADVRATIDRTTAEQVALHPERAALQVGQRMPDFTLPDATGRQVSSTVLRAAGPLLVTFYRGEWCPYCNLALQALQRELPALAERGVTLVAISPEQPDHALSMQQKHALAFPVLSDAGNRVAQSFGLVFTLSPELQPVYRGFGIELPERNGDGSQTLPLPGTFLVDRGGIVRAAWVDADYRRRLEPATAIAAIDALAKVAA